jgi:isoquinoline 1-oxidoreductase beta subunit
MNAWVVIGVDDVITVRVSHTEMGQGIHTLAVNLVAEELEVDPAKLKVEVAPVAPEYETAGFNAMVTGDSSSAVTSFDPLRLAGASARMMLVAAAAKRWHCAVQNCEVRDGRIRNRTTGAVLSYGAVAEAAAKLTPPRKVKLKPPSQWRLLGRPMRRLEGHDKVRGAARFGIDVQVPGMLIGSVLNCPVAGGRLRRVGADSAMAMPGVVKVLPLDDAVIVVAKTFWAASKAIDALSVDWDEGPGTSIDSAGITQSLDKALTTDGIVVTEHGDAAPTEVHTRVALRLEVPLLAHGSFEPLTAAVSIGEHDVDVWAPTQVQTKARDVVAEALEMTPEQVRIHTTLCGGSFGRKLGVDYLRQAAIAAKAVHRPVKLIWSRNEDIRNDYYRPPAATMIEVGLNSNGLPISWTQKLAVPDLRPHPEVSKVSASRADTIDSHAVEGAAPFPYQIGHHRLTWHNAPLAVRLGWWRSVGHSFNAWFVEHAMDVIARKVAQDPVAFRLALLKDRPRHQAVLRTLGSLWPGKPKTGRFRGTAIHECYGSVVAQSVEISIEKGMPTVHRVACAVDCGTALDPDGVRAQMEGGIIFGLTAALFGEITVQNGRTLQNNFDSYRLLALGESPEVTVAIVNSGAAVGGVGEAGVPPIAPAVCNAVLAATGQPVTRLPIRVAT